MTETSPVTSLGLIDQLRQLFGARTKTSLVLAAIISFAIFWYLGSWTDFPAERGFNASVLEQPSPIVTLFVAAIGLAICTILISTLQGQGEVEDPLFGVALGLAAWSCRGGTVASILQYSSSPAVFILSAFELILLFALLAGCWWLLWKLRGQRMIQSQIIPDDSEIAGWLTALITSVVVMVVFLYILGQTDEKKQAMWSVAIAAFAGSAIAFGSLGIRSSVLYAITPLIVGVAGYLLAYFAPGNWLIARTGQPLAYALPLDYASVGVAGSLLGYWTIAKWRDEGE
jgi:nicotinamide riboside transporter PnuC